MVEPRPSGRPLPDANSPDEPEPAAAVGDRSRWAVVLTSDDDADRRGVRRQSFLCVGIGADSEQSDSGGDGRLSAGTRRDAATQGRPFRRRGHAGAVGRSLRQRPDRRRDGDDDVDRGRPPRSSCWRSPRRTESSRSREIGFASPTPCSPTASTVRRCRRSVGGCTRSWPRSSPRQNSAPGTWPLPS